MSAPVDLGSLEFRPAIDFDYTILADAFNRAFEGYVVTFRFDARALESRARPESWDLAESFLAFRDEDLAGALFLARRGRMSRVAAMGVTRTARGRGVGRAMMQHAIATARARGDHELLLEVIESNAPACRLYESVGLTSTRRLVGFETVNPPAAQDAAELWEIDVADFAALAHAEYARGLPWQMRPETLANLTAPNRAFSLEGRAFALIGDPAAGRVALRGLVVPRTERRRAHGSRLLRALFAKFPGRTWVAGPIIPEGLADDFFLANGFIPTTLAQWEMRFLLG